MGFALKLYEAFEDLGKEKAAVLAEFAEWVETQKAATKDDLRETEKRLELKIEEVRANLRETEKRLELKIERVRADMVKWMFLFWAGQVAAVAALFRWVLG